MEFDCIVVGSGAAALTAAVVASQSGQSTLVLEKADYFGGTSAKSGGVAWVPDNRHFPPGSEQDSLEKMLSYLEAVLGPALMRPELMRAFYFQAPQMLEYLETNTEVRFDQTGYPDFRTGLPGALSTGRSVAARAYDGRRLGRLIERLEPPFPDMCLLGGMMFDGPDLFHLLNATKSLKSFRHVTMRFVQYLRDRLIHPRGMRLTFGNALIGGLLKAAADGGATLWHSTPVTELLRGEDSRITGVKAWRNGEQVAIKARHGVILATGGFARNLELARKYLPPAVVDQTRCVEGATGDGITMALSAGASLGGETWQNFLGNQSYKMFDQTERVIEETVHMRRDRNKPGFVLVDQTGRRFANEASSYHDLTNTICKTAETVPSFLICDHVRLRKYGIGLLRPGPVWLRPLGRYLRSGHLIKANTISGLAQKLGINPANLSETVRRNNEYARAGHDPEFGKGNSTFDRWQGDPAVAPNPNLGPIETGPFYATKVWPTNLGTFLGLNTDDKARVLDDSGMPIGGLYACGCDMHHPLSGAYAGGGSVLGPGMTFGYIAAKSISERSLAGTACEDS